MDIVRVFKVVEPEIVIQSKIPSHYFFFRKGLHKGQVFLKDKNDSNYTS